MPIEGVLFSHDRPPVWIEIEAPPELGEAIGKELLPAAVAVRADQLKLFAESPERFKNRHQKDERKALSALLLRQGGRIPFIDANLTSAGRLKQSVKTLLENAAKAGERGIYVIGVGKAVFETLKISPPPKQVFAHSLSQGSALADLLAPLTKEEEKKISEDFWGESQPCHLVRQLIQHAARISDPVLILGETGTGKGVVANAIHKLGRGSKPYVEVNCGAIPPELFETELFGSDPGAYTGAPINGRKGLWELAGDGSIFLDEIGDLNLDLQVKILHTLERGFIRRVGGLKNIKVFARVIAATNRSLWNMVQAGKFREDLYYRLRHFLIFTPELRGDPHNLELISNQAWRKITGSDARLPQEILDDLCSHRWPGNVRELKSVLGSLNNFFGAEELHREHLDAVFQHFGLVAGYGHREAGADRPALLQVECLKKICRADDAIHACEQELKPLEDGPGLSPATRESLERLRVEMQSLMRNRLYFGSPEAYQSFSRVEGNLAQLLAMPQDDAHTLFCFWRETLEPEIQLAVVQLFAELQKLRELAGARAIEDSTAS